MKDSPEHELFRKIEHRLRNYTEQPDDVLWSNISNALEEKRESRWIIWFERGGVLGAVSMFLLLAVNSMNNKPSEISLNKDQQSTRVQLPSRSDVDLNVYTPDQESGIASNKILPLGNNEVQPLNVQQFATNQFKVYKEAEVIDDTGSAETVHVNNEPDSLMNTAEAITETQAKTETII